MREIMCPVHKIAFDDCDCPDAGECCTECGRHLMECVCADDLRPDPASMYELARDLGMYP